MDFRLGCAVWGYKDWVGEFFPPKTRSPDFLSLYSRRLTAVEGNTTFYAIPDAETVKRWADETPESFHFCPKLHRSITHQGALAPRMGEAIAFLHRMQGLGDRLGPLFIQLPPSYGPDQFADLRTFLEGWPTDEAELSIEVRHLAWFQPPYEERLNELLTNLSIGRVSLDTRPIYDCDDDPQVMSERKKPRVPLSTAASTDVCLVRYISHPDADFNQPYLQGWLRQVKEWLQADKRVYFFVHCPLEERSVGFARRFQAMLETAQVPVPPLPWNMLAEQPSQLSLF